MVSLTVALFTSDKNSKILPSVVSTSMLRSAILACNKTTSNLIVFDELIVLITAYNRKKVWEFTYLSDEAL